ncbi:LysM peptidoglycan-binding domain-containing protein [Octadecabacter sp. G9-8]|uniref:LysM peptidoglycan-binding domain-containing protein n=1 Tax=Octadecabacter dasysiphoniae TaxID=2909341 RepID=A0ABS9CZA8_9RHOB|nr:LysM peptidoglycan-binding domain-containing protein [Octadecabacter dasysiphoniae]MCF2871724.1 LysM peptidoglycan-binding domain-containing protein [Octadecabacter dasysiphoniae]
MIRTTVALFVFALFICGLIIFRPFAEDDVVVQDPLGVPIEDTADVTRAATPDISSLAQAAVSAAAPLTIEPATGLVEAPRRIDVLRPNTDDTRLSDMTNNVLAELGFAGVKPVTTNSQAQRQSTSEILAGIEAATGQQSILEERDTLEAIVIAALRAGETDEDIDTIINDAAAAGNVAVPQILVTSDGRVDTHVLLNNIVSQAQIAAGGTAPTIPDATPENTQGMEVRVVQRATDAVQARFYTVQSGDSLGAIAITFFGSSAYYDVIFEANKGLLSSPDRIRVGQRLVIPRIDA